ncbi:SRR1-like protein isoform X1 [Pelobates fuscus]|uniref:SRR1-like protein isoform X1 n=2 Tax=Pelobates fuscus TaxID=191477 RepID=UPI002FE4B339
MALMDLDDWQVVKKKKAARKMVRRKDQPMFKAETCSEVHVPESVEEQNNVVQRIYYTVEDLKQSEFWGTCQECFHVALEESDSGKHQVGSQHTLHNADCVCYGLGNFSSCVIARHQLAFLLLFLEQFKIPRNQTYVFDPVFSMLEISVLQELGLSVISENEEGKRTICRHTVFYMPHCGKALYNNLLWSNWSQDALSKLIVIGNSFKGIEERMLSRILQKDYVYIQKSLKAVEEAALPENHQFNDVFNDISIHYFPIQKLRTLPNEIWKLRELPKYYDCDDLEIIRK